MLVLSRAGYERLRQLAHEALPVEACALLIGTDTPAGRVVRAIQPAGQGERAGYAISAREFYDTERRARRTGAFVCGVFHSHPDADAHPSERDIALAWPGLDYLILGTRGDQLRTWRLADDRSAFDAAALLIERA